MIRPDLTEDQARAILAALDGFEPQPCLDHCIDGHGDEANCFGYGPRTLIALAEGQDVIAATLAGARLPHPEQCGHGPDCGARAWGNGYCFGHQAEARSLHAYDNAQPDRADGYCRWCNARPGESAACRPVGDLVGTVPA